MQALIRRNNWPITHPDPISCDCDESRIRAWVAPGDLVGTLFRDTLPADVVSRWQGAFSEEEHVRMCLEQSQLSTLWRANRCHDGGVFVNVFKTGVEGDLYCAPQVRNRILPIKATDGSYYWRDEMNRARVFHGLNVVYKRPPYHPKVHGPFDPLYSLTASDMKNIANWGFNLVRLGVPWVAVEPTKGAFNNTYLAIMRKIVDDLYANGIYTVVDFHQDAFSRLTCGEGFPKWVVRDLLKPDDNCGWSFGCDRFASYDYVVDSEGYPLDSECLKRPFTDYNKAPEVQHAWGNLYANRNNAQERMGQYWKRVSETFKTSNGVLGYDIINEPIGDTLADVANLNPGNVDWYYLGSNEGRTCGLYQNMAKKIREGDGNAVLMYENAPFPDTIPVEQRPLTPGVHAVGFTPKYNPLPDKPGESFSNYKALNFHYYSCGFACSGSTTCPSNGNPPDSCTDTADTWATDSVESRVKSSKRLEGGVIMSEFGSCEESLSCVKEIERVIAPAEKHFLSWAYWQFKYFDDVTSISGKTEGIYAINGSIQSQKLNALQRTYAPEIGGDPLETLFNSTTLAFRIRYVSNGQTTRVYAPATRYPFVRNGTTAGTAVNRDGDWWSVTSSPSAYTTSFYLVNEIQTELTGSIATPNDGHTATWSSIPSEKTNFILEVASSAMNPNADSVVLTVSSDDQDNTQVCFMQVSTARRTDCAVPDHLQDSLLFSYKVTLSVGSATFPVHGMGPILNRNITVSYTI